MFRFFATLHVLGTHSLTYVGEQADVLRKVRDDRGSITIEQVVWAVAIIAIAAAVITAITQFVESEAGKIKSPN